MKPTCKFTEAQFHFANQVWGCNCGPSALAFATEETLLAVKANLPDFDKRRYTNPTMMRQAIYNLGWTFDAVRAPQLEHVHSERVSLVRIQWLGPWTTPKPTLWASRWTHWIATYVDDKQPDQGRMVFDCNGGERSWDSWLAKIAPLLIGAVKNCTGFRPANVWRLEHKPHRLGRRHKGL